MQRRTFGCQDGGGGAILKTYYTTFPLTESPIVEDGGWRLGGTHGLLWTNPTTSGGLILNGQDNTGGFDDSIAIRTGFRPNQFARSIVHRTTPSGFHEIEHLLRFHIINNRAFGYEVLWSRDGSYGPAIVRWNGPLGLAFNDGAFDTLHDFLLGISPADGDQVETSIVNTLITVKLNGSTVGSYDVGADGQVWNTGSPGVGSYRKTAGAASEFAWTDVLFGEL